ncbi:MAG: hypothetical protein DSY82_00665 [Flavobacteriia bacterium]|nr:MAG: hypothetical protein DSY82_00665 [Flavobacteriia bacterium]
MPQDQEFLSMEVDYNTVDVYPLFRACNNCDAYEKQNLCFESVLVNNLEKTLNKNEIVAKKDVFGPVFIDLLISKTGKIKITKINTSQEIRASIPEIDSILKKGVEKLPVIVQPALKRGIPVEVQFRLQINLIKKED